MTTFAELLEIGDRIDAASRVLLSVHPQPDGDALGSAAALSLALVERGIDVEFYCPEGVPDRFAFLRGLGCATACPRREGIDITLLLDCSDDRSLGRLGWSRSWFGTICALDHHQTVHAFADQIYSDPEAAATGLVVFRLLEAMNWAIDLPIAEALYCALISDTGSFRYQNTSGEALRAAAKLVDCGVDPWRIASSIYERRPVVELRLLAEVLRTLKLSKGGAVAVLRVERAMLVKVGCDEDAVDGFVNFARGIEGVEVAALIRQREDFWRVSLRSRGGVDVALIAEEQGGGGHRNAAGFDWQGDEESLCTCLEARTTEQLKKDHG